MSFIKLIIFLLFSHAITVFAATTVDCEPASSTVNNYNQWSEIQKPFELKSAGVNVTLGSGIPDGTLLYEFQRVLVGVTAGTCSGTDSLWTNYMFKLPAGTVKIASYDGTNVYPSGVDGIGISINEINSGRNFPMKPYPDFEGNIGVMTSGTQFWVDIKFWKIPGNLPTAGGAVTIRGIEMMIVNSNSTCCTVHSNSPGRVVPISSTTGYLSGSRVLQATLVFQPGTCDIEGNAITVNMGDYNSSSTENAPWKDASFKLLCPDSYGFGGKYDAKDNSDYDSPYNISPNGTLYPNTSKNGRVRISIVPFTEVIDSSKGIIALDGTGAKGYGIQLAWGDYSNQNNVEPATPVIFNAYVAANSLNSAFLAGDTPIGGNGFSGGDNTIKMAARYVRTAGEAAPGPANAIVQVIANYQ